MKKSLIIVIVVVVVLLAVVLTIALCPEKKPEAKPEPPKVSVYVSPLSAISPVNYNVRVNVVSEAPLRKVKIFFEGKTIFERDIAGDTAEQGENFNLSVTGGGKFADISMSYTAVMTGAPGKIVSFLAQAEDERGGRGEGKKEVIIFENKPCDVRIYIVSPQGTPIGLPPFSVQIGASVSDDRCGAFNHASGTACKFRFIWDADNRGGEFSADGETEQPLFAFTYQELGIFTPQVKVIDDGGNECISKNPVPVFVAQKIDNITLFENILESPKISVIQHNGKTKLFISKFIGGLYEYSVSQDGTFIIDSITRPVQGVSLATPKKTDIGDFLMIETPDRFFVYPISGSVRWGTPLVSLERSFTKSEIVSFSGRVTFILFFVGNFLSSCFFIPERELFGEVCLNFELNYNFFPPYVVFADEDNEQLYLAHFIQDTTYDFVIYSFPLTFDEVEKIYVLDRPSSQATGRVDYPPSKLSFFRSKDGKLYLVISTSDQIKSASFRMYFFDVENCISGSGCSPLGKDKAGTYIRMGEFISDIPSEEICAFSGLESYYIDVLDYILMPSPFSGNFSFCSSDADCILSLLCLDEVRGRKCVKNAFYPFLFINGKLRKNLKTNCIPLEYNGGDLGQKNIIHAWDTKGIFDSGKFIFSIDFSKKRAELVDSESYFVDPVGLSGYKKGDKLIISRGGKGGIDILEFDRDGEFIGNLFHLYVRPQGKWSDLTYSIPFHYLDEDILIVLLQKPGCGEPENFSGIFVYDMEDRKSLSMREYKAYKSLNDIGVHSVTGFAVRRTEGDTPQRWNIVLSGILCQQVGSYILSFSVEKNAKGEVSLREVSRIKLDEGNPESFFFIDDDRVVFTTESDIYLISASEGKILKKIDGEGGGKIFMYNGVIYEFVSEGGYFTIKTFDMNLNKIRDFSFYIGIYPSVSRVHIARVIDEFYGFGELDFAFVGLSSPELLSNISALVIFDITDFVRRRGDIEIFGITPGEFYIGARDFLFFRTDRNMVFLLDFSGAIARVFLR